MFLQEGAIGFAPRFDVRPPAELLLLACGNLPAMAVSVALRPDGQRPTPAKLWDPVWFSIHEAVSFLLWFALGAWLDSGVLRIRKLMVAYLAARFTFAAFLAWRGVAEIGRHIEVLCWLAFGVYVVVVGLNWVASKIRLRS